MSRLWVALLFVVVLALLLTVGLTVTFVYRSKKGKKEEVSDVKFWTFLTETEPTKKSIIFDITKSKDYLVDDFSVTLRHIEHKFYDISIEGWAHTFAKPLKVVGIEVNKKQIGPKTPIISAGFTVFIKEGKPDFVTLWHDGDFHHYTPKGNLMTIGLFPFAGKDLSKSPLPLNLPKGTKVGIIIKPEPSVPTGEAGEQPVTPAKKEEEERPKEPPTPPTEPGTPPSEEKEPALPTPEELKHKERKKLGVKELTIDLNLAKEAKLGKTFGFMCGDIYARLVKERFGPSYYIFSYTVGFVRRFHPSLRYGATEVKLLEGNVGTPELFLYTYEDSVPLVVSYTDDDEFFVWKHLGFNHWEKIDGPVTPELLENVYCFLNELVSIDFSKQLGSYNSGEFEVAVTKTNIPKLGDEFVCFEHKPSVPFRADKPDYFKVFRYKFRSFKFNGLPMDKKITHVTGCFWEGNLGRPLLIRLGNKTEEINYVGHRDYVIEKNEDHLPHRVARVNLDVNRATKINVAATADYKFTGGDTTIFSFKDIEVKEEDSGVKGITKFVHRLSLMLDDKEPFHISGFVGHKEVLVPSSMSVSSVETYFVRGKKEHPILVIIRDHLTKHPTHIHYLLYPDKRFELGDLINGDLEATLRHLAHSVYNAVVIDFSKHTTYFYTGFSISQIERTPTVFVKRVYKDHPHKGIFGITYTVQKTQNSREAFIVLEYKNNNFHFYPDPLPDEPLKSINLYYTDDHRDIPEVIVFRRIGGDDHYMLNSLLNYVKVEESQIKAREDELEIDLDSD